MAATGEEVLDHLESKHEPVDLILMDVQLPEVDGLTAARIIRNRERGVARPVPIVGMTALGGEEERERCLAAGMDDCVSIPIDPGDLFDAIARVLSGGPASSALPVFDRAVALYYVGGDPRTLRPLLEMFLGQGAERMSAMQKALEEGDAGRLGSCAHSLKGTAATLGMPRLCGRAEAVERMAAEGAWDGAAAAVGEMRAALDDVMAALRAEVES